MNKFVTSALALAAAGSLAHAGTGDGEWLELDSEIASLSSALAPAQDDSMGWSALLRTTLTYSDDDVATGGDDDVFGFSFEDVDLAFWGRVADYGWRISADVADKFGDDNDFVVEDAYAWWEASEYFSLVMGQYKARVLRSNAVNPENQLFINRTAMGAAFDVWDLGAAASGNVEVLRWYAQIQNGANDQDADHRYVFRVEFDLNEGAGQAEGALGASDDFNATIGVTYLHDDTAIGPDKDDAQMWAVDVWGSVANFGFGAEFADFDDGLEGLEVGGDFSRLAQALLLGENPWSVTGSFLINEMFEVAGRWEDLDDVEDTEVRSLGVNYYQSGHNAKWQFSVSDVDSDSNAFDGTIWQLGLVVGSTGNRIL